MADTYANLIDAVARYYGSGSDQWQFIIQNLGTNDLGECAKLLKSVPGVDVWTDGNGRVVNYAVHDVLKGFSESANIGNVANSNTIGSVLDSSVNASIPSIISQTAETGTLSGISGIGLKASTGTTVTGIARTIGVGVGAVALGAQLGKVIGTALYEGNPNTWDEGVISGLSNEDWGKFAISLKNQAKEGILGLFGVDGDTTTMYLDENFAGYMAWYMAQNGMLDVTKSVNFSNPDEWEKTHILPLLPINLGNTMQYTLKGGTANTYTYPGNKKCSSNSRVITSNNYAEIFMTVVNDDNSPVIDEPYIFNGSEYQFTQRRDLLNGKNVFYGSIATNFNYDKVTTLFASNNKDNMGGSYLAYILNFGDVTEVGYNGIESNPNSTQFDPTGVGSVATALGALKNQYPELWDNAVKTKVPQEDGTEDERTYIPLPIPNFSNPYDTQPTTGTPSQTDPSISPETTPEEELDNNATNIAPPSTPSQDPNTGGGNSPTVVVPTQTASALWAIYNPSLAELNSLGAWLWSSNFIDQILKIFNDPMQAIIGLHKVYATPSISGSGNIKVGYLDSGVSSNIVGNQYTYIDCGTVSLREYYGNILDYSPYTDVKLYLPFIGIVPLDIADVSRASISIRYGVDVLTGACLASVSVQRDNAGGVLYQYSGNCACQYPLSSGSYMGMVTGAIGAVGSLAKGNIFGGMLGISGMHTNIEHSGGFSGNAGAMGIKKPYLIISRPQSAMNDGFPSIQGYPSNAFVTLNSCTGFTQVKECHVENVPATDKELEKIESLLKEGVII